MLTQIYNNIQSHRKVGTSDVISHLLEFPDHYTDETFVSIGTTQLYHYFEHLAPQSMMASHSHDASIDFDKPDHFNGAIVVEDERYHLVTFFNDYQY